MTDKTGIERLDELLIAEVQRKAAVEVEHPRWLAWRRARAAMPLVPRALLMPWWWLTRPDAPETIRFSKWNLGDTNYGYCWWWRVSPRGRAASVTDRMSTLELLQAEPSLLAQVERRLAEAWELDAQSREVADRVTELRRAYDELAQK